MNQQLAHDPRDHGTRGALSAGSTTSLEPCVILALYGPLWRCVDHFGVVWAGSSRKLCASVLEKGAAVSHQVADDRQIWLQLGGGTVEVQGEDLRKGDGLSAADKQELRIVAIEGRTFYCSIFTERKTDETGCLCRKPEKRLAQSETPWGTR
jgi:hypothetical protein